MRGSRDEQEKIAAFEGQVVSSTLRALGMGLGTGSWPSWGAMGQTCLVADL